MSYILQYYIMFQISLDVRMVAMLVIFFVNCKFVIVFCVNETQALLLYFCVL